MICVKKGGLCFPEVLRKYLARKFLLVRSILAISTESAKGIHALFPASFRSELRTIYAINSVSPVGIVRV